MDKGTFRGKKFLKNYSLHFQTLSGKLSDFWRKKVSAGFSKLHSTSPEEYFGSKKRENVHSELANSKEKSTTVRMIFFS